MKSTQEVWERIRSASWLSNNHVFSEQKAFLPVFFTENHEVNHQLRQPSEFVRGRLTLGFYNEGGMSRC